MYYLPIRPFYNEVTVPTMVTAFPLVRDIIIREEITILHGHGVRTMGGGGGERRREEEMTSSSYGAVGENVNSQIAASLNLSPSLVVLAGPACM